MRTPIHRGSWQLSFVALSVFWGCNFWCIKLGLQLLPPIGVAFVRLSLGALLLLALCAVTHTKLPRDPTTWRHLVVVALLFNSAPMFLVPFGETHVSSIVAGLINSLTPLLTFFVMVAAFRHDKVGGSRVAGIVVGLAGILIVLGLWNGIAGGELVGSLACLVAVTCNSIAFPYTRKHLSTHHVEPLALVTGQVTLGALMLLPGVALDLALGARIRSAAIAPGPILGLVFLGIFGTGVAYFLNFTIIAAAGSTTATTVTYVIPIVVIVVGTLFLHEHLHWYEPVGGCIVLVGVAMSQGRFGRSKVGTLE